MDPTMVMLSVSLSDRNRQMSKPGPNWPIYDHFGSNIGHFEQKMSLLAQHRPF